MSLHKGDNATTTNSTVYARTRKRMLAKAGQVNCDRCPVHKKENEVPQPRSWKHTLKVRKQWMKNV